MELFREDGCMTDAGFRAMMDGQLDELGRLEAAEHLSYCDQCMDRYTALLTADALETPPKSMQGAVMGTIWARLMQNTYGRAAVAGVAAVLALTLWRSGALQQIIQYGAGRENVLETDQSQLWEPGRNDPAPENTPQYRPIEDDRPQAAPEQLRSRSVRKGGAKMELFREDGCMTDAGFRAMMDGQLDELGRLEAAEHLSYCDQCMDRYTALLTADALETPPKSMQGAVMGTIWARLMQNTYGRAAVAGVAAVLALTLWRSGALQQIIQYGAGRENVLETDQSQLWEPGRNDPAPENTPQYRPIEDDRPQAAPEQLGRPVETKQDRRYAGEGSSLLHKLLTDVTDKIAGNTPNTEK